MKKYMVILIILIMLACSDPPNPKTHGTPVRAENIIIVTPTACK